MLVLAVPVSKPLMFACSSPIWPEPYWHGVVTPSHPAGVGSTARPTFAPSNWSFSSALMRNSVLAGVMPAAASRWKNVAKAASYALALLT